MNFIVRAFWFKNGKDRKGHNDFWEFETVEDAKDFADYKADQLRKNGYEFDVRIYELTNY